MVVKKKTAQIWMLTLPLSCATLAVSLISARFDFLIYETRTVIELLQQTVKINWLVHGNYFVQCSINVGFLSSSEPLFSSSFKRTSTQKTFRNAQFFIKYLSVCKVHQIKSWKTPTQARGISPHRFSVRLWICSISEIHSEQVVTARDAIKHIK